MDFARARGLTCAMALLVFSAFGCGTQTPQDVNASVDENAVSQVTQEMGDCNDSCGYWFCEVQYTPCVDGRCQGSGNCCTPENEQSDCAFLACSWVGVCCPAQ